TYTLGLASSDPGADTISSWTVNWGDGSAPQVITGNPPTVTHVYANGPNRYSISATATDEDGTYAAGNTVGVTVNNVAPALNNVSITSPVDQASPATLTGSIVDPGTQDPFTLVVNWGDGSALQTFHLAPGTTNFSENHTYLRPGNYSAGLTLSDNDHSGGVL